MQVKARYDFSGKEFQQVLPAKISGLISAPRVRPL